MNKKSVTLFFSCLIALAITLSLFTTNNFDLIKIKDVAKSETVTLMSQRTSLVQSGLTIHVYGNLDGDAIISAGNWAPKTIRGNVDWEIYHDWFSESCVIRYDPQTVKNGELIIEYEFH